MSQISGQIPEGPEDIRPLQGGARIPKLTLRGIDGGSFDLNGAISKRPSVLIFYRGGW